MFALVDCDAFYASCETVFQPHLRGKPVVVLSNNDGCVIARSTEAKALGIKMGVPAYQIRTLMKQFGVRAFSSNFCFYGDMSRRVVACLEQFSPNIEIYSIDESFLDCFDLNDADLKRIGHWIYQTVPSETGIPVGVGLANTKTLAKAANKYAKKHGGVCIIRSEADRERVLRFLDVDDVWGVGFRWAPRLHEMGVHTAWDLALVPENWIKQNLHLPGLRMVRELNWYQCYDLESQPALKQNTAVTRSFGREITDPNELWAAVRSFTSRAAERIRQAHQVSAAVQVFAHANRFKGDRGGGAVTRTLLQPTDDTTELLRVAKACLKDVYQPGVAYKKAGVLLLDLSSSDSAQMSLFGC